MPPKALTKARRARRAEAPSPALPTREVILDTAERLFAARGADGVAVRDLAREMDLTAPSLYNHFPSKQALYDAVLERGLRPLVELMAQAWYPGALRPEHMRATVEGMVTHLATHPHLARLLQRALLEDTDHVQTLIARWLEPLYRSGVAVIKGIADDAGWEPSELPYLTLGLFGMVFAYFTNAAALQSLAAWPGGPLSARSLAGQRAFLEKALYRLLGPQAAASKGKARS